MIITISGDIGSGKSTTGRLLADNMGYHYLSTGSIQRKIASKLNLTTLELNLLSEKDRSIDDRIDNYTRSLVHSEDNYVVDSRLAWHFIPSSYKVYLLCQDKEAAWRISQDKNRKSDETYRDIHFLLKKIKDRRQSEARRFKKLYNVDFQNLANYDLIVDSTYFNPEEIVELIKGGMSLCQSDQNG